MLAPRILLAITLLTPVIATAQVATEPAPNSSAPAADPSAVEALYQSWTKDKDPDVAREYFTRFPDGPHHSAIIDEICNAHGFAKISGAPLLVRFRGFHVDNTVEVHDGKTYSGIPGFNMKPVTTKRNAKPGRAFVFVAFELFAFAPVELHNADLTFSTAQAAAPNRTPMQLYPIGTPVQAYGAFAMSPAKLPHLILQAVWDVSAKQSEAPKLDLFKSHFDLVALKAPRL